MTWTRLARSHLLAIHDYIAADSRPYALQTVDRITWKTKQLIRLP